MTQIAPAAAEQTRSATHSLTGVTALIRLALRRDRIRLPVWILAIVGFTVSFLPSFPDLYPDAESRQARAALMDNPAMRAISGAGHGLDDYTFGAMVADEYLALTAVVVALMSVLLTVRHTRAEEEAGRAELVRSAVVGRHAALAAAVTVVVAANVVMAALLAVSMPATLDDLSMEGSLTYAAALAAVGVVFVGVGALAAQFTHSARGAVGIGTAVLGAAFLLRAAGDAGDGTLSWLSPIGWSQYTKPYVDDEWQPLLLSLAVATALTAVAVALSVRRDVGSGLKQPSAGPAGASRLLSSPLGLAWTLQRGVLAAWALGLAVFGAVYGSVAAEIEDFAAGNEMLAEAMALEGGVDFLDAFFGMVVMLTAILTGGYAIQAAARARSEEASGRVEPLLAAPIARWRYAASHLTIALLGAPAALLTGAFLMGVTASAALDDRGVLLLPLEVAVYYIPALWLLTGVTAALFGLAPKATGLAWAVLAYAVLVSILGVFLQLPDWAMDLSPFEQIPQAAVEDVAVAPLAAVTAIAVGLLTVGLVGFRRRNLT